MLNRVAIRSPYRILHGPENECVRKGYQGRFRVMGDFAQDGVFQGGGRAPGNNPQVTSICNIRCGIRPPVPGILWAEMRMRSGGAGGGAFLGTWATSPRTGPCYGTLRAPESAQSVLPTPTVVVEEGNGQTSVAVQARARSVECIYTPCVCL